MRLTHVSEARRRLYLTECSAEDAASQGFPDKDQALARMYFIGLFALPGLVKEVQMSAKEKQLEFRIGWVDTG
jgi:hypothetical protein